MIKACIFDAFGTLFNLDQTLLSSVDHPLVNDILSYARSKQLSYTWLRTLMHEYQSFDLITKNALKDGCEKYGAPIDLVAPLSDLYFKPVIFDDVIPALNQLKESKIICGVLSNGTLEMLRSGININGINDDIDVIYSADTIKMYKPSPEVYQLVVDGLNLSADEVLFVSSNQWDVAGGARFGFHIGWVNRKDERQESIARRPNVLEIKALSVMPTLFSGFNT